MGNQNNQQAPPPKPVDPMDTILELRLTQKRLEGESRKAEKEAEKNMQKARQAMAKNQEESARMYLTTVTSKKNEANNLLKMAQKVDYIQSQIRTANHNKDMMMQLGRITPALQQINNNMPIEQMYAQMTTFDQALDDILVQGKVMDQMMNKDSNDVHSNLQVDMMLQQMKQEEAIKMQNNLQPQQLGFQSLGQQQQQQQYYNPQQQQQYNK